MTRRDGTELVFNACPQLESLNLTFRNEDITTLTFDSPSLTDLDICEARSVENCNFECPKMIFIHLETCPNFSLPASLMSQLIHITSYVSLRCASKRKEAIVSCEWLCMSVMFDAQGHIKSCSFALVSFMCFDKKCRNLR